MDKENKTIWCDFTDDAKKMGYRKGGNKESGRIVGESRDKKEWLVVWDGIKTSYRYYKEYIKIIK